MPRAQGGLGRALRVVSRCLLRRLPCPVRDDQWRGGSLPRTCFKHVEDMLDSLSVSQEAAQPLRGRRREEELSLIHI
eukprot:1216482-Pyramimonas_sp.AAC.1